MARSLKGKTFFICHNNGITGVVEAHVLRNIERRQNIERHLGVSVGDALAHMPQTPIFTIGSFENHPFCTAPHDGWLIELKQYIEAMGGEIQGGSFYVPFSNQFECGRADRKTQLAELRYVTSDQQFEETFGASLHEVAYGDWKRQRA